MDQRDGPDGSDFRTRILFLCSFVAAVSVFVLFMVLHELMASHSAAIITAGLGGIAIGVLCSRLTLRNATARDMTWAGGLGGGVGLMLLHILPLIH